jgi:TRAP-type C4-dicarboxylate transport system permease small subunit
MGLPGMVISGMSVVVGAIMYWAITAQSSATVQSHGFRLSTVGVILMIAGVIGFVTSLLIFVSSRRSPATPSRTLDRETTDQAGHTTSLHERQR